MRSSSTGALLVSLAVVLGPRAAHADTAFGAGSVIIPASSTYQTDCGAISMYGVIYNVLRANPWLAANGHGTIDVYYAFKDTKASPNRCTPTNLHNGPSYAAGLAPGPVYPASATPVAAHDDAKWNDGCDFEVYSTTVVPVTQITNTTASSVPAGVTDAATFITINTTTAAKTTGTNSVFPNWPSRIVQRTAAVPATNVTTVRYWGGSFIINDADAAAFLKLIDGTLIAKDTSGNNINFTPFRNLACTYGTTVGGTVAFHRAQVAFTAPTPRIFTAPPPRLALLARNANQSPLDGSAYTTTAGSNSFTGRVADNILQKYLSRAGLTFAGAQGCPLSGYLATNYPALCPSPNRTGEIYDLFDFRDIVNNRLADVISGGPAYKMLWAPHWELNGPRPGARSTNANETNAISKIATFLDGKRGLMAECASIESFEGVGGGWLAPASATPAGQFQTCKAAAGVCGAGALPFGIQKNSGATRSGFEAFYGGSLWSSPSSILSNCSDPVRAGGSACAFYGYPGDPFAQVADYRWNPEAYSPGSHLSDYKPRAASMYRPGVRPLVSGVSSLDKSKLATPALARSMINGDYATRNYKDDDTEKSNILYLGNHDLTSSVSGTKIVLQTLLQLGDPAIEPVTTEVARSTPIVATIDTFASIVQGTFESVTPPPTTPTVTSDDATLLAAFQFPDLKGHMRAVKTSLVTTAATSFEVQTAIFDAADRLPGVTLDGCAQEFNGTCRTIFTNTTPGVNPTTVTLDNTPAKVGVIGPLMAPTLTAATHKTLIEKTLAGVRVSGTWVPKLGGVDRSSVAVIPPSQTTGDPDRPTVIYFGAADGMLHAVCGSATGSAPCDVLGRELWAFLPRTQLGKVRMNTAKLDGSPRVQDLFGDFSGTGTGTRAFRTILTFQTGSGDASLAGQTPAVYALDITDPTAPRVLWEFTTPATRTATELGQGLTLSIGNILSGGVTKLAAFAQTNNGGTGGAGNVVTAIDIQMGTEIWKTGHVFPPPRIAASGAVPASGIPGGAVVIDRTSSGRITDVVFGTLYGDLWLLDAATGGNRYGTTPLFRFTADKKPFGSPPALYASGAGTLFAVAASGGYADPAALALWSSGTQQVVAVSLNTPSSATLPLDEGSGPPEVPWTFDLGTDERAFSQAVVIGGQVFISTDSTDVNALGYGSTDADTGKVHRMDVSDGGNASSVVVRGGAGGIAHLGTDLFSASSNRSQRLGTGALGTAGDKVNDFRPKVSRRLWIIGG